MCFLRIVVPPPKKYIHIIPKSSKEFLDPKPRPPHQGFASIHLPDDEKARATHLTLPLEAAEVEPWVREGLGFRVWGLGFRVSGLGFGVRVSSLGLRVWGLGFTKLAQGYKFSTQV